MADTSKINLLGLVGVLGAILLIVGVFLDWAVFSAGIGSFVESDALSGWEVFNEENLEFDYAYAPVIALVAGIIGLIACVLPVIKPLGFERILGLISFILAIVAVIIIFLFNGQMGTESVWGVSAGIESGIGVWISLAGGILTILGSLIPIVMKKTA